MRILLVEDNEDDILLVQRLLAASPDVELEMARTLEEAQRAVRQVGVDVVLLDLTLPDSSGMLTLEGLRTSGEQPPVVILTGINEEAIGLEAVKGGAQDYLVKDQLTAPLLLRSMRYAVARQRMLRTLSEISREEERLRELYALERLTGEGPSSVTARSFEIRPLRDAAPGPYEEFKNIYATILTDAFESKVFKVDHRIGDRLRRLAEDLGKYRAAPRDVVQIHLEVLQAQMQKETTGRAQAYLEEGRLLVLEFMGNLAAFYRGYFFGG